MSFERFHSFGLVTTTAGCSDEPVGPRRVTDLGLSYLFLFTRRQGLKMPLIGMMFSLTMTLAVMMFRCTALMIVWTFRFVALIVQMCTRR